MMAQKTYTSLTIALIATVTSSYGATTTWTGGAGTTDYSTAGNWDNGVPNLNGTDNAFIGGTAEYDATTGGGDLFINAGSTLTITSGGSFEQTVGGSWMQFGGGTLNINNGGSFSAGTAGNMQFLGSTLNINPGGSFSMGTAGMARNAATTLNIGSDYSVAGNFIYNPSATGVINILSGADFQVGNEIKTSTLFSIAAGASVTGRIVAFADFADGIIDVSGTLNLSGDNDAGLYAPSATKYVNIASASGKVVIDGTTETAVINQIAFGGYRFLGVADDGNLTYADLGSGVFEITAVPEPGTYALIAGMLALGSVMMRRRQS
jgi:hypothetical protein